VLYGVGGAALVTGMIVLLLAPRRARAVESDTAALGCQGGPGELGLACAVGF
jgi:hypothetical protein